MGNIRSIVGGLLGALASFGMLSATDNVEGWLYSRAGVAVYIEEVAPSPSGKCETCNGTGRVGDGRVFTECLDCGGDGIVSELETVSFDEEYDVVCQDGSCNLVRRVPAGGSSSLQSSAGLPELGDSADHGPVRRVLARVRENKPVRTAIARVRENKPVRTFFRNLRCR